MLYNAVHQGSRLYVCLADHVSLGAGSRRAAELSLSLAKSTVSGMTLDVHLVSLGAGSRRVAELSSSLGKSTGSVMTLAGRGEHGPTHDRQEVQLNLMALNLDMSGSSM